MFYICKHGQYGDVIVTQRDGAFFLNTIGIYIDRIADMDYREELLKVLIPEQMKIDGTQEPDDAIEENVDYMEVNLSKKLTLHQIAGDLGYNVSYMTKLYRQQAGKSVIDAFIDLKMTEARRQIQEGNMNISQIAAGLGYDNMAYFCGYFVSISTRRLRNAHVRIKKVELSHDRRRFSPLY